MGVELPVGRSSGHPWGQPVGHEPTMDRSGSAWTWVQCRSNIRVRRRVEGTARLSSSVPQPWSFLGGLLSVVGRSFGSARRDIICTYGKSMPGRLVRQP